MIPKDCKRLAEVDFPIAVVSRHAAREKSIRHGHPSTLHLWWARRPLAACRAMLMALLLPDPCHPACPEQFKQKARQLLPQTLGPLERGDAALRPDPEVELIAMRVAQDYERSQGRTVYDVHDKDLGYDLTSIDLHSGELRLIEVKGIGRETGAVLLTPNERRVAEDRRDCYWLYVVTNCKAQPQLQPPIRDPARFPWQEITKVEHYCLDVQDIREGG